MAVKKTGAAKVAAPDTQPTAEATVIEYVVINEFQEKNDDMRLYKVGDPYPAKGFEPTEGRIEQLSTSKNKYNRPFIAVK